MNAERVKGPGWQMGVGCRHKERDTEGLKSDYGYRTKRVDSLTPNHRGDRRQTWVI